MENFYGLGQYPKQLFMWKAAGAVDFVNNFTSLQNRDETYTGSLVTSGDQTLYPE